MSDKTFILPLLCFFLIQTAQAQIVYVNADATGNNDGTSWTDAYTSLQDGLTAAAIDSSDIWVAEGIYYPDEGMGMGNDNPFSTFSLRNEVSIYGGFPGLAGQEGLFDLRNPEAYETTLSGDLNQNNDFDDELDAFHVTDGSNTDSTAVIDGFSIVMGNAVFSAGGGFNLQNRGGGMLIQNGSPTVRHCKFMNNKANFFGGAISNLAAFADGNPTIENCYFEVNFCLQGNGGAIHNEGFGVIAEISIHNSQFVKNVASDNGGAFFGNVLDAHIDGCEFMANFAQRGGAIYTQDFIIIEVSNSMFKSNLATEAGGAIHNPNATVQPTFINNVYSGNLAPMGAGIFSSGADANIFNCSFSGNHAEEGKGGGIANIMEANATISNSIFWNNLDETGTSTAAQIYDDSTSAANVSYSTVQGGWTDASTGGNNIADDPLFTEEVDPTSAPTEAGDLSLQEDSPAINAGNNDDVPDGVDEDIAGEDRILQDTVDMGAYEFNPDDDDDDEPLEANCQDLIRNLNADGLVEIFAEEIDGGSSGGSGNLTLLIEGEQSILLDCDDVGTQPYTLTVIDEAGNSATCTANITVVDNLPPSVACKDFIVELDANGNATISLQDITSVIEDNCGIGSTQISQTTFDCDDVGDQSVEVTVNDVNGNATSCISIVTVMEDETLPANWNSVNIGDSNGTGYYSDCQDAFVLSSDGFDPSASSDALQFVYQDLCEGGEIIAELVDIQNPGFAGVSIREGNFEGARKVDLLSNGGSFIYRRSRTTTFGAEQTQLLFRPGHNWFRIMRFGPVFRGFTSTNGIFWQVAFQVYLPMGTNDCLQIGLMVHSTDPAFTTTASFDNVSIGGFPTFPITDPDDQQFGLNGAESNFSGEISVYPNPSVNVAYLNLERLNDRAEQITLSNSLGQIVKQIDLSGQEAIRVPIDISQLSNGVYELSVFTSTGLIQTTKLVVSNVY
jgi:predicted outer membrane repeat protein